MSTNSNLLRSFRRAFSIGAFLVSIATSTSAQPRPWVGFSSLGADLLAEEGLGHEGPGAADYFGFAVVAADFNGDGVDDLVTGLPGNDCDFVVWDCGATVLRLGVQGAGLSSTATRQVQLNGPGDPAFAEYGATLTAGDFNGDGRADLAVGMPGYGVDWEREGAVQIHFGDEFGGLSTGITLLREGFLGVPGSPIPQDEFGFAMAAGDFNGDGFDDLAVGIPGDLANKGMVTVAHGAGGGLIPFSGFVMQQGLQGLPDTPEFDEEFGYALAAADFNDDGFDDLAIGVPSEDDVGAVLVVFGSPNSLIFANHEYFSLFDLGGVHQPGSRFGSVLAPGDWNGDGVADLAIGAPLYDGANGLTDLGLVTAIYGTTGGFLPFPGFVHMSEASTINGSIESGDRFGSALAAGDFDDDGVDDLAIGIPGDNYNVQVIDAGAVAVVLGRHLQFLPGASRFLAPGMFPQRLIPDVPQGAPGYGSALAAGDFDGNGFSDLAIGAPRRDIVNVTGDVGGVAVLFGQLFVDGFEAEDTVEWSASAP
jgi:hypothetical protein